MMTTTERKYWPLHLSAPEHVAATLADTRKRLTVAIADLPDQERGRTIEVLVDDLDMGLRELMVATVAQTLVRCWDDERGGAVPVSGLWFDWIDDGEPRRGLVGYPWAREQRERAMRMRGWRVLGMMTAALAFGVAIGRRALR